MVMQLPIPDSDQIFFQFECNQSINNLEKDTCLLIQKNERKKNRFIINGIHKGAGPKFSTCCSP